MTEEVEGDLTLYITMHDQQLTQATEMEPFSYLYRPGWVMATIATGQTYVH